ncbi:hypothetical protein D9M69_735310 [compost metagenome]
MREQIQQEGVFPRGRRLDQFDQVSDLLRIQRQWGNAQGSAFGGVGAVVGEEGGGHGDLQREVVCVGVGKQMKTGQASSVPRCDRLVETGLHGVGQ